MVHLLSTHPQIVKVTVAFEDWMLTFKLAMSIVNCINGSSYATNMYWCVVFSETRKSKVRNTMLLTTGGGEANRNITECCPQNKQSRLTFNVWWMTVLDGKSMQHTKRHVICDIVSTPCVMGRNCTLFQVLKTQVQEEVVLPLAPRVFSWMWPPQFANRNITLEYRSQKKPRQLEVQDWIAKPCGQVCPPYSKSFGEIWVCVCGHHNLQTGTSHWNTGHRRNQGSLKSRIV